jgi:mRNA-degrading endonuclease toxin of MazEF toxin-antitoxin module
VGPACRLRDFPIGHVYWVEIPDDPGRKRRPALVLSPDVRNALATDVIVVPLSSVLRDAPTHVRLRRGEAGIKVPSMVKCEQITTLQKDRLVPPALGGPLSAARMHEIEKSVLRAIGVMVPM